MSHSTTENKIENTKIAAVPLNDAKSRRDSVCELTQNIIVLAGAGTGKTTILINRLALLVVGEGIPVEKIVALTFTKKAAEEMRVRLEEKFQKIIQNPHEFSLLIENYPLQEDIWKERAQKGLEQIPKAQIGTIHSFAGFLLRLFPVQVRVDPCFIEDDGGIQRDIFDTQWTLFLESELGLTSEKEKLWLKLLSEVNLSDLKELSWNIVSEEIELGDLKPFPGMGDQAQEWHLQLQKTVDDFPIPLKVKSLALGIPAVMNTLLKMAGGKKTDPRDLEFIKGISWKKLPTSWKLPDEKKAEVARIGKGCQAWAHVNEELFQEVVEALTPLISRVRREMAQKGILSFPQLLVFARNLLRDYPLIRQAIKKQFHTFLVDEFQDTDPLQGEILLFLGEMLEGKESNWRKVKLASGRLFIVGDPKQSIYRFRGADIAAFEEIQEILKNQGALELSLISNFRSHPQIIDVVNHVFPKVFESQTHIQPPYEGLEATRRGDNKGVGFLYLRYDKNDEISNADSLKYREAEIIADQIIKLTKKGPTPDQNSSQNPFQYKDFALLFRSSYAFEPYLEVFKNKGIPYLVEGEKFFYRTPEVTDFLNLVSVVLNPTDQLSLVGVLRSVVGGLTDLEILELKNAGGLDFRISPSLHQDKLKGLFSTLHKLWEKSQVCPLSIFLRKIIHETGFWELTALGPHGEQSLANIRKILTLALKWEAEGPLDFKTFVMRFKKYQFEEKEEGENPLADSQFNAVKIMTIHKAKGLEFPVVFLPNLSAESRGGTFNKPLLIKDWRRNWVGLRLNKNKSVNGAMATLEEESLIKDQAEEIRVFYVASTRAKERLYFTVREKSENKSEALQLLKKGDLFPGEEGVPLRVKGGEIPVDYFKMKGPQYFSKPPSRGTLDKFWDPQDLARLIIKRKEEFDGSGGFSPVTSPTAMAAEHNKIHDEEVGENIFLRSQLLGLVCHKVLEYWDFKTAPNQKIKKLDELLQKSIHLFEIDKRQFDSAPFIEESRSICLSFFNSPVYQQIAQSEILGREIPFFYPLPNLDSAPQSDFQLMRGIIDLIYKTEKQVIIADYKTSRDDGVTDAETNLKYASQAEAYRQALWKTVGADGLFEIIYLRSGRTVRLKTSDLQEIAP